MNLWKQKTSICSRKFELLVSTSLSVTNVTLAELGMSVASTNREPLSHYLQNKKQMKKLRKKFKFLRHFEALIV